jgi:acid phosphatase type 7
MFVVTTTPPPPPPGSDPVLAGAGDIAACGSSGDESTAVLLDGIVAANANVIVFTAGDNAYENGTGTEYANCYGSSWGRHRSRTRPAPGNHDYHTADANGYFGYFGAAAGDPGKGYYSYELGSWHIIALNSNCTIIACGAGSAQEQWLRADLAAHPAACTLAYWHHPRFSSGSAHGSSAATAAFWQALYDHNADLVIAGHDHLYERFAPQAPNGAADSARGIRQFVAGTGGRSHYAFGPPIANSEVRNGDTYGVLQLTLRAGGYEWQFVPEAGKSFTDLGSGSCH